MLENSHKDRSRYSLGGGFLQDKDTLGYKYKYKYNMSHYLLHHSQQYVITRQSSSSVTFITREVTNQRTGAWLEGGLVVSVHMCVCVWEGGVETGT